MKIGEYELIKKTGIDKLKGISKMPFSSIKKSQFNRQNIPLQKKIPSTSYLILHTYLIFAL